MIAKSRLLSLVRSWLLLAFLVLKIANQLFELVNKAVNYDRPLRKFYAFV